MPGDSSLRAILIHASLQPSQETKKAAKDQADIALLLACKVVGDSLFYHWMELRFGTKPSWITFGHCFCWWASPTSRQSIPLIIIA